MTPHRMSSLPIARYCGLSPTLLNPSGRAAVISTAFHSLCSKSKDTEDQLALLTDEEREELATWTPPQPVTVGGVELHYADARTEYPVSLPCESGDIEGHPDMVWRVTLPDGQNIVFVGDIKKSRFSAIGGLSSLQLHAYAIAEVEHTGADGYYVGIWLPVEAEWEWSRYVDAFSPEYARTLRLVKTAAQTPPEAATGRHCADCWSRLHCPAYTLPAHSAEGQDSWLVPLTKPGGLTQDNAAELLLKVQAVKKVVELAEDTLKAYARERGIPDGKGKVYAPGMVKGRESVCSVKELREHLGEGAEQLIKQGRDYERFSWRKAK